MKDCSIQKMNLPRRSQDPLSPYKYFLDLLDSSFLTFCGHFAIPITFVKTFFLSFYRCFLTSPHSLTSSFFYLFRLIELISVVLKLFLFFV